MKTRYWKPLKRKVSPAEVRFLRRHFGNLTLRINRQAAIWKFESKHTHTIRFVRPGVYERFRPFESETFDVDGEWLLMMLYIGRFNNVVEFEVTTMDGKPLRRRPRR